MGALNLTNLRITGDISVKPVTVGQSVPENSYRYLIMGPTGAGKSAFIEALADTSQNLAISKNQLDGYTQQVSAYKLVNVWVGRAPIYLIDTPGFSDPKLSDVEIVDMVRRWLQYRVGKRRLVKYVFQILFLTPITDTRLAGCKSRTINMMTQFLECGSDSDLGSLSFVTTMWDSLPPANQRIELRVESNFSQLRDEVFKAFIDDGANLVRFRNTRESALAILDHFVSPTDAFTESLRHNDSTNYALYQDLHERIENALQTKRTIEFDLVQPDVETNVELKFILEQNQRQIQEILFKFISQLAKFGPPPRGFEYVALRLRKKVLADVIPITLGDEQLFQAWAQGREIALPSDFTNSSPSEFADYDYFAEKEDYDYFTAQKVDYLTEWEGDFTEKKGEFTETEDKFTEKKDKFTEKDIIGRLEKYWADMEFKDEST